MGNTQKEYNKKNKIKNERRKQLYMGNKLVVIL